MWKNTFAFVILLGSWKPEAVFRNAWLLTQLRILFLFKTQKLQIPVFGGVWLYRNIKASEDGCNATSSFRFMQNSTAGEKKKIWQRSYNMPSLYISFVYLLSKYTNTGAISSLFPSRMMARLVELVEREDPEETWLAWAECQHSNTLLREMTHTSFKKSEVTYKSVTVGSSDCCSPPSLD